MKEDPSFEIFCFDHNNQMMEDEVQKKKSIIQQTTL
jgi:hypothetical protein